MKKTFAILSVFAILFLFASCSGTRNGTSHKTASGDTIIYVNNPISLANMLVRLPGVRVDDFGANPKVFVRGGQPLFVIDGIRVGRDFAMVERTVNVNAIAAIELLTDPSETIMYGAGTQFGVIVIHTGIYDPEK